MENSADNNVEDKITTLFFAGGKWVGDVQAVVGLVSGSRNIGQVTPKIIDFYCIKLTFMGSKYPPQKKNFEELNNGLGT